MDHKATVRQITHALTDAAIIDRLGVSKHSLRAARLAGAFPASWYAALHEMCRERGVECPMCVFNWRTPGDALMDAPSAGAA